MRIGLALFLIVLGLLISGYGVWARARFMFYAEHGGMPMMSEWPRPLPWPDTIIEDVIDSRARARSTRAPGDPSVIAADLGRTVWFVIGLGGLFAIAGAVLLLTGIAPGTQSNDP